MSACRMQRNARWLTGKLGLSQHLDITRGTEFFRQGDAGLPATTEKRLAACRI